MKLSMLSNTITTKIRGIVIEIIAAVGATILMAIFIITSMPYLIWCKITETYKKHRDMEDIYRDIEKHLGQHRDGYDHKQGNTK